MSHSPSKYTLSVASIAALSALVLTPNTGDTAWVTASEYGFTYDETSTAAADGVRILNGPAGGGSPGRWLADRVIYLSPSGVAATDVSRSQAAVNAMSGWGTVAYGAGQFIFNQAVELASYLTITADEATEFHSTMAPHADGGDDTNSIFHYYGNTKLNPTTLAADLNPGDTSAVVASAVGYAIGDYFGVYDEGGARVTTFKILNIVGTTLTLDRPNVWTTKFANGSEVYRSTPLVDFIFSGNGCLMTGTGDRWFSVNGAIDCLVENVRAQSSFAHYQASYDLGCVRCTFRRISARYVDDGAGKGCAALIALESSESCTIDNCSANGAGVATNAIHLSTSTNCTVRSSVGENASVDGLVLATNGNVGDVYGCRLCFVDGGLYSKNARAGVYLDWGSTNNRIVGVSSTNNGPGAGGFGFYLFNQATAYLKDNVFSECHSENNAFGYAVLGTGGGELLGASFLGCTTKNNTSNAVSLTAAAARFIGCIFREAVQSGNVIQITATSDLVVDGCSFYLSGAVRTYPIAETGAGSASSIRVTNNLFNILSGVTSFVTSYYGAGAGIWRFAGNTVLGASLKWWSADNANAVAYSAQGDQITMESSGVGFFIASAAGSGDPNGAVFASVGSTYQRDGGGAGTSFYVKEAGKNTNANWVGK